MIAELHTHTIASGHAFSTLDELVRAAAECGIGILGVVDHGPSMEGAPHAGYFDMCRRLPRVLQGVRVLVGCEANIVDLDGRLDLDDDLASKQPLLLAGLHARTPYPTTLGERQNTRALVAAMENPSVHVISHPYHPRLPVAAREIADAAVAHRKLVEVNLWVFAAILAKIDRPAEHPAVRETRAMLARLREGGGDFVLGTDAHHVSELRTVRALAPRICDLLGVAPNDALNGNPEALARFVPALSEPESSVGAGELQPLEPAAAA